MRTFKGPCTYGDASGDHIMLTIAYDAVPIFETQYHTETNTITVTDPETGEPREEQQIVQVAAQVQAGVKPAYEEPFQATRDAEGIAGEAFALALSGSLGSIAAYVPQPLPVPQIITRRQCAIQMRATPDANGQPLITAQEMYQMTALAQTPAMVTQLLAALPDDQRYAALTDFAADNYLRSNSLLNQMMAQAGYSDVAVDQFFRDAAVR